MKTKKQKTIEAHETLIEQYKNGIPPSGNPEDCPLCRIHYDRDRTKSRCQGCTLTMWDSEYFGFHGGCDTYGSYREAVKGNFKPRIAFHKQTIELIADEPEERFTVKGFKPFNIPDTI